MTPEAAEAVIRASLLRDAPPSLCWAVLVCHRAFISSDDFFAVLRRILEEKNASVVPGLVRLVSAWTLQLPPSPRDDPKTYGALREFLIKLSEESRTESSCTRLLRELDKEKVTGEEESVIPVTLGGGVHLSWTNVEVSKLALALSHMTQELLSRVPHSELLSARWTGRDDAKVGTSKTALEKKILFFFLFSLSGSWLRRLRRRKTMATSSCGGSARASSRATLAKRESWPLPESFAWVLVPFFVFLFHSFSSHSLRQVLLSWTCQISLV